MGDTVLAAWAPTKATSSSAGGSHSASSLAGATFEDTRCARSLADPAVVGLPMAVPPGAVALLLLNLDGDSSSNYEDDTGADNRRGMKNVSLRVVDTVLHSAVGAGADATEASRN